MSETKELEIEGVITGKSSKEGETNENKWKRYAFVVKPNNGDKETTISTFYSDLARDSVVCHYKNDGKYNTLVGFEELDKAPETEKPGEMNTADKHPEEEKSGDKVQRMIVRQNVLNRAVDMYNADKLPADKIYEKAEEFEAWVWTA